MMTLMMVTPKNWSDDLRGAITPNQPNDVDDNNDDDDDDDDDTQDGDTKKLER